MTTDIPYRCVANTTAGYFMLPNYANGGNPGPLLPADFNISASGTTYPMVYALPKLNIEIH